MTTTPQLTAETIEAFLACCRAEGRTEGTLYIYRTVLERLQEDLPEGKALDGSTAGWWQEQMAKQGYARRTVRTRISIFNQFLVYIGRREWQFDRPNVRLPLEEADQIRPELTREEYLRLLQAARVRGEQRTYLLIKTMGSAGVRIQELPQVTVEAAARGTAVLQYRGAPRRVYLLPPLGQELLDFAREAGVSAGPVFQASEGGALSRAVIWRAVNRLSQDAQVPPEKANPRCLWKLYQATQAALQAGAAAMQERSYAMMLEEEELRAGWKA